jgi:hypothetical protein
MQPSPYQRSRSNFRKGTGVFPTLFFAPPFPINTRRSVREAIDGRSDVGYPSCVWLSPLTIIAKDRLELNHPFFRPVSGSSGLSQAETSSKAPKRLPASVRRVYNP